MTVTSPAPKPMGGSARRKAGDVINLVAPVIKMV